MSSIPSKLARFVHYGTLPNGEVFATGYWISLVSAPANGADFQSTCDDVAASVHGHLDWFQLTNNSSSHWIGVKGYYHAGAPGSPAIYAADSPFGSAVAGSAGGNMPNQVAVVATLLTGQSGRSYKGRMYIPATGIGLTSGFIGSTLVGQISTDIAGMLGDLGVAAIGGAQVVSITKNVMTDLTAVRVDNRADIQRRRANKVVPTVSDTTPV